MAIRTDKLAARLLGRSPRGSCSRAVSCPSPTPCLSPVPQPAPERGLSDPQRQHPGPGPPLKATEPRGCGFSGGAGWEEGTGVLSSP